MSENIRVLIAKVGLDGHDRGVKIVARALRDAGMDVIYTGLHRTPEEVVDAAIQEDVDVIGVSILSGAHMTVFPRILKRLEERGADDILVVGGGVIPDDDVVALKALGVEEILLQDTPPEAIVAMVRRSSPSAGRAEAGIGDGSSGRFRRATTPTTCPPRRCALLVSACARRCRPAERERAILERLQRGDALRVGARAVLSPQVGRGRLPSRSPALARGLRGEGAGRSPRQDLRDAQARVPPFGDYLCVAEREIYPHPRHVGHDRPADRVRASAATTGSAIANAHARIMWGMGIRPGDTVFIAAIFSLYMGSWGTLAGAERLRCQGVSVRRRRAGHDRARGDVARPRRSRRRSTARRRSRCTSPRSRAARASIRASFGLEGDVLLRRARRVGARRARPDRGDLRRAGDRLRLDGRDDAVHERRRHAPRPTACSAGRTSSTPRSAIRQTFRRVPYGQRGTPVYTHLERTSQPMIRLVSGRPHAVGERPQPVRPHLSAAAAGHLRPHRRHVHDPRRERLSERGRRRGEPARRLRRRAPHRHHARRRDGRAADPRRGHRRAAEREGPRRGAGAARTQRRQAAASMLGLRAEVEVVPPGTFPRTDFKARRVDRRPRRVPRA